MANDMGVAVGNGLAVAVALGVDVGPSVGISVAVAMGADVGVDAGASDCAKAQLNITILVTKTKITILPCLVFIIPSHACDVCFRRLLK
jgi:hypothetical protein